MSRRHLGQSRVTILAATLAMVVGCGNPPSSPAGTAGSTASPTAGPGAATPGSQTTSAPPSAAITPLPAPAITGLTGRMVFTRAGGAYGDETLFVARIDGSRQQQLGEEDGACCPWALRDGSRLVRTTITPSGGIETVISRLDGSDPLVVPAPEYVRLGSGPMSPSGSRIVLEGFSGAMGFGPTYIANIDASGLKVLTEEHFIPGDFSPDGKHVVLFKTTDGSPPPPGSLWTVDVNGSNLRQLTPPDVQVQCCFNYRWSPDGRKILFAHPEGGLWTIAPDGTGLTEIFRDTEGRWAITPTWSPDGSMILFALDPTADPLEQPNNGLFVIRADGTGLTLVLGGRSFKREPVWVE